MGDIHTDPVELYRIIKSRAKNDLPIAVGNISFADLMVFFNIKITSQLINKSMIDKEDNSIVNEFKKELHKKKLELEMDFPNYIATLSDLVNFINGRRDRKKILMKDGINFLNYIKNRVSDNVYDYLVKLYSVEKYLVMIKCYELKKVKYDSCDF